MNIFLTSDNHFYHKNVLKFEQRPFETIEEMNAGLIKVWNETVGKDSIVYHLGDFCFGSIARWKEILPQLNGKIRMIRGNHDDSKVVKKLAKDGYFDEYHDVGTYIKIHGYQLWLTHYPMEIGNRPNKYSISGHIHSTPSNMLNQINVGVDSPLNAIEGFNITKFGQPISLDDDLIPYLNYINPKVEELFQKERGI